MYDPSEANPAYQLRYTWTGWRSQRKFEQTPVELLDRIEPLWEEDGTDNLHIVLVTAERFRVVDKQRLAAIRDGSLKVAKKKAYSISRLSVMPDHLHLALRGDYAHPPDQIASAFQNNLAYALGQERIWCDGFYVGTFGEYNMEAIRRKLKPR